MRVVELIPGDVFYLSYNLDMGPLVRKYSTTHGDGVPFVLVADLNPMLSGSDRFIHYDSEVIKVGRIEVAGSREGE